MLIKTIAEVKAVLRISNLDDDSSLPDIASAEETYIVPAIGTDQYDALVTAYDGNTLTAQQEALLLKIQKPLAAFAYYDDLPLQHAMITDAGVRRTTTDNSPSAFRWEFDGVKDALANKAYQGMESLLKFIETNIADYPLYAASDAYTKRKQYLIKSGDDFTLQYQIYNPYRTFNSIMGVMGDVETFYVIPLIGKAYFDELKALASPTDNEKQVIADLKKAIAHLTIFHAIQKFSVKITTNGLTIYNASSDRGNNDQQQAPDNLLSLTMKACERDGQNYLTKAKKFLNDNASGSIFANYFASTYYVAPADYVDPNTDRAFYTFIR